MSDRDPVKTWVVGFVVLVILGFAFHLARNPNLVVRYGYVLLAVLIVAVAPVLFGTMVMDVLGWIRSRGGADE